MRRRFWAVLVGVAVLAVVAGSLVWRARQDVAEPRPIVVPDLSPVAQQGRAAYDRHCAECHGPHAAGSADGFSDMPAQPDVREDEIAAITRYARELQVANGIE